MPSVHRLLDWAPCLPRNQSREFAVNHGRSLDRIDGWWSKPPQDLGERALVGRQKDPVEEKRRARFVPLPVSLDNADAFIDALTQEGSEVRRLAFPFAHSANVGPRSRGISLRRKPEPKRPFGVGCIRGTSRIVVREPKLKSPEGTIDSGGSASLLPRLQTCQRFAFVNRYMVGFIAFDEVLRFLF